jgi:hypothetical protein
LKSARAETKPFPQIRPGVFAKVIAFAASHQKTQPIDNRAPGNENEGEARSVEVWEGKELQK